VDKFTKDELRTILGLLLDHAGTTLADKKLREKVAKMLEN
jgi:hypothetical protein